MRRLSSTLVLCYFLALALLSDCSHTAPFVSTSAPSLNPHAPPPSSQSAKAPPTHDLEARLLLLGDSGANVTGNRILTSAGRRAGAHPKRTTVLLLGDNIYPSGLPDRTDSSYGEAEARLQRQLNAFIGSGAEVLLIAGNHDWAQGGADGLAAVKRQERFVEAQHNSKLDWVLKAGEPGPVCLDRGTLRLVFLDTQWWLHPYEKPNTDPNSVLSRFRECLNTSSQTFVFSHHPLHTTGVHGGFHDWQDHVFPLTRLEPLLYLPLPILGSLYPFGRRLWASPQDSYSIQYKAMLAGFLSAMKEHRPLLWAGGHEHNLQLNALSSGPIYSLVSGAGSKKGPVTDDPTTLFAQEAYGFVELDVFTNKEVQIRFFSSDALETDPRVVWQGWLAIAQDSKAPGR